MTLLHTNEFEERTVAELTAVMSLCIPEGRELSVSDAARLGRMKKLIDGAKVAMLMELTMVSYYSLQIESLKVLC